MIAKHLTMNESTEIKTLNMQLNYEKNNVSALLNSIGIQDGAINLPSFCDLFSNSGPDCQNSVIIQKVRLILYFLQHLF